MKKKVDKRKLMISIIAGFLAAVLLFGLVASAIPVLAGAERSDEIMTEIEALQQKQKENEAKIAELQNKVYENMSAVEAAVAKKSDIDQQIFVFHDQVQAVTREIVIYNGYIAEKQSELDAATLRWENLNAQYKERIRAMEENGSVSYWSVIFKANSFSDLLDRLNMIQEIAAADKARLKELDTAAKNVATAKTALEGEKVKLEAAKIKLEEDSAKLDAARAESEQLLQTLLASGEEFEKLIEEHERLESETAGKLEDLGDQYDEAKREEEEKRRQEEEKKRQEEEKKRQEEEEKRRQEEEKKRQEEEAKRQEEEAKRQEEEKKRQEEEEKKRQEYEGWLKEWLESQQTDPFTVGAPNLGEDGKIWLTPITFDYLSSPFGYRWHPISGDYRFHYGVDLAAPQGRPIVATRSGKVKVAAYEAGGAGYYVNLDHLDGYISRYMHMTHYIVYAGQYVEAGQIIGYCGSTGGSTGPHLHFGIYKNGEAVNPAKYIKLA